MIKSERVLFEFPNRHSIVRPMSEHVYKMLELVGSSKQSSDAAVRNAVERAGKTIRNMRWLEVTEVRGHLVDNRIDHWQVKVKVGFTLD